MENGHERRSSAGAEPVSALVGGKLSPAPHGVAVATVAVATKSDVPSDQRGHASSDADYSVPVNNASVGNILSNAMTDNGSLVQSKDHTASGAMKGMVSRTQSNQVVVGFESCVSPKRKIPADGVRMSARRPLQGLLKK